MNLIEVDLVFAVGLGIKAAVSEIKGVPAVGNTQKR